MTRATRIAALLLMLQLGVTGCNGSLNTTSTNQSAVAGARGAPFVPESSTNCPAGGPCVDQEALERAPQGAAPPESNVGSSTYTVAQYLEYIIKDLDYVWSQWFFQQGLVEPMVGYEIVTGQETYLSTCTDSNRIKLIIDSDYPNAIYCPADMLTGTDGVFYQGVMVFPEATFLKMWTGDIFGRPSKRTGDFAAAAIVAHEFGHHVNDELTRQGRLGLIPPGKNKELLADCLAGNWMTSAYYTGLLTDTDFEEAVAALEALGDNAPSNDPHGTPAERMEALSLGYHGNADFLPGSPMACFGAYAK